MQVCLSKVDPHDDAGNDALLARLQKEFKEFSISFPLVLRWMVQLRKFKSRVFKTYLLKHAASALTTREAYLELQAEYLVLMYRAETNHPTEKAVQQYRKMVIDSLMKEDKDFMALNDQVEKEMADQMVSNDQDRRQRLYAQLLSLKVQQGS